MNYHNPPIAPAIDACHWLNCKKPLVIDQLRGKVIVLHAFQMLCPGCVVHGLPQASSIHALYPASQVQVIGLHCVFEHHDVMTVSALKAFVHEYKLQFPIAVDTPGITSPEPNTMRQYQLKGTPSLVLIDKAGQIRLNHFGRLSDMQVGNFIGRLLGESFDESRIVQHDATTASDDIAPESPQSSRCDDEGCQLQESRSADDFRGN